MTIRKDKMETKITIGDTIVFCYGELYDCANFDVVCEDEEDDFIWCERDPDKYPTWKTIIEYLNAKGSPVVELSAV